MPSGKVCPCTPAGGVDLATWNASCGKCWNRLRGSLKRLRPELVYLGSVEVQKRGALHRHIIVWVQNSLTVQEIRPLAILAGFGHSVDLAEAEPGSRRFAYYVSKYITKSCDERDLVPWRADMLDEETGEVRSMRTAATFRTWSSSREWGLTMREVRALSRIAARASAERLRAQSPPAPAEGSEAPPSAPAEPPD